jgi:addiction module RelE/StbE family toxin
VRLRLTRGAERDLDDTFDYISADNPQAAQGLVQRLRQAISVLSRSPYVGRRGKVADTRELVIARTKYIAVYRVLADEVIVIRVLHGSRQWPE